MSARVKGLTRVHAEREVERILKKQARGEKLTSREQRLLAYTVTAAKNR
jgi:hypothetical protein